MKKYIILSVAALCIASCSNSDNIFNENGVPQEQGKLTPVTISAKTSVGDNASTRAYWSIPTGEHITVTFIKGEQFDLFEYGYSGKQVFTCTDATTVQSGNFSGNWQSDGKHWAAILPSGNGTVTMGEDGTNTYNVTLPATQTTSLRTETNDVTGTQYIVSPDPKANVMIASVNDETANNACFLAPICSYLYFATPKRISEVKISATNVTGSGKDNTTGCMAGPVTVQTGNGTYNEGDTNGQWQAWAPFVSCIKSITPSSGTVNEITVKGALTNRNSSVGELYEYVACIYGGNYTKLTFKDASGNVIATTNTDTKVNTFKTVYCHYLGKLVEE